MAVHNIRYIIEPASACPLALQRPPGLPGSFCEVDTDEVALCAMGEILQTGANVSPMSMLFDELLVAGQAELVWKGRGPGRGIEMRRAFSGLFGRFFARAYLQRYHGFTWFAPIDGTPTYFSNRVRVRGKRTRKAELPDWLCAGPGQLAIAEAKGSHQKGNATKGGRPGPIKTAAGQINGVVIEKSQVAKGIRRWIPRSVKGWAVMSRWGVEEPPRDAFQYVLDPDTTGEPLMDEDKNEIIQDVAHVHIGQILEGLGYGDLAPEFSSPRPAIVGRPRQFAEVDLEGETKRSFIGAVAGPFGLLPISVQEAQSLIATAPHVLGSKFRFVGLDLDVILKIRDTATLEARPSRKDIYGTRIGPDGLLFAPLNRIAPRSIDI